MHSCMSTVQLHAVWPNPCCVSMSMLHIHVHTACHLHVACSCQCCIPWQCYIPCQCCILCQCFMSMSMSMYIYAEMPECRTVRHPVSPVPDWKKLTMPEQFWYWIKLTLSSIFLVRYWTKIRDAGMLMPALVSSVTMPSYVNDIQYTMYTVYKPVMMGEGHGVRNLL
jgi:hypothetical protein